MLTTAESPSLQPRRVLIVDDCRVSRALLRLALRGQSYEVVEAPRLADARKLLAEQRIDLLVVDGLLPDGMGLDWIKEVRKQGSRVPILFLTSFFKDFASFQVLHRDLKVAHLLHKPVTPPQLLAQVNRALAA